MHTLRPDGKTKLGEMFNVRRWEMCNIIVFSRVRLSLVFISQRVRGRLCQEGGLVKWIGVGFPLWAIRPILPESTLNRILIGNFRIQ